MTENGRLKRSSAIDEGIRQEGLKCIDDSGTPQSENEGLLYVMYQLADDGSDISPADVIPRYIGKAEVYGKKRELSSNFVEIANERDATRSFARWGDGDYWHVGELSMAIHGDDERKVHWADALFEPGTRRLREPTYLWVRAWNPDADLSPYGIPAFLAEVEPQLIGLAYDAFPERLLNKEGTPAGAAIRTAEPAFESASR